MVLILKGGSERTLVATIAVTSARHACSPVAGNSRNG